MKMPDFLKPLDINEEKQEILKILKSNEALKEYTPLELDCLSLLTNAFLTRLNLKINELNYIISQNYIDFAQGEFLDALVALAGVKRLQSSKPIASVEIKTKAAIFLPKNTKFVSSDGVSAFLVQDEELKEGENICYLETEKEGAWATEILELNNPLITEIKILGDFKIYEQGEDDEALKKRFFNALSASSSAGSEASYSYHAHVSGVDKIKCYSENKGEVNVVFVGEEALKSKIEEALKDNIPITDTVFVKKAKEIIQNITISLRVDDRAELSDIYKAIKNNLNSYFKNLNIGQNATKTKLLSLCFVNAYVLDAKVNELNNVDKDCVNVLGEITFERLDK